MKSYAKIPLALAALTLGACGGNQACEGSDCKDLEEITVDNNDDDGGDGVKRNVTIETYVEDAPKATGASCTVDYKYQYSVSLEDMARLLPIPRLLWDTEWLGEPELAQVANPQIDYPEPEPESFYSLVVNNGATKASTVLTMPSYTDNLELFDRAKEWVEGEERCYMTSKDDTSTTLTQEEAYDLYVKIAEKTVGVTLDQKAEHRNVVGIRGAHPGQFFYNGNLPNRFNDTIVLLWIDLKGQKHVREFPVIIDTGVQKSSSVNASSLQGNRHYRYVNGEHKGYNALHNNEYNYKTRDDANNNSFIDSDRNGWLKPTDKKDYDRTGSGHNIHYGKATNLRTSPISNWSAGCQVIPGMKNWTTFITKAWTGSGKIVDYYLIDVRDIDNRVWNEGCEENGTHECPFHFNFKNGSFSVERQLMENDGSTEWDSYNCSTANEAGPEHVYVFTWDASSSAKKTLTVNISSPDGGDPDIYLLDGDDNMACMVRNDKTFEKTITPGRYYIVVDTYVKNGVAKVGTYKLEATLK